MTSGAADVRIYVNIQAFRPIDSGSAADRMSCFVYGMMTGFVSAIRARWRDLEQKRRAKWDRVSSHLFYRAETISLHFVVMVPERSGVATEIYGRTSTMETDSLHSFREEQLGADNNYGTWN